jgi:hypothetical protein
MVRASFPACTNERNFPRAGTVSLASVDNIPLPIASEVHRLAALERQMDNAAHLIAIGDAAVIAGQFGCRGLR